MKHSAIRQRIIETASSLFYENGYNSTGINEIIAEAGIAKATLYSHFKSKDDICLAYLQYKNAVFTEDIKAFCEARPEGKKRILALFDFLQEFFQDRDFNGCWCIKTVSEIPKDNVKIRDEIQGQKSKFIEIISALVDANLKDQNKAKSRKLSRQIYLMYEGAVAESHLHQDDWPIKEMKSLCAQILD